MRPEEIKIANDALVVEEESYDVAMGRNGSDTKIAITISKSI